MNSNDSGKGMKKILKALYEPVAASSEFREELLERLTHEFGGDARQLTIPLWKQPRLFVAIATALIIAAIGYGIWIPLTLQLP